MACKFMVNSAFKARLLLRLSHQRTVLFGTVNKLGCPIPGRPTLPLILSSRSYSESTPTPPFPKSSGSSKGSESSGPKDKNWSPRKDSGEVWAEFLVGIIGGSLTISGLILITYATQPIWVDWYEQSRRRARESARESAIYEQLKKGPVFNHEIDYDIPRNSLVEKIKGVITPRKKGRFYPLVVGECGTGKTSLIELAINSMNKNEPKGIVYFDMPIRCDSEVDVAKAMREALGLSPDRFINSSESTSLHDILRIFSKVAIKYKQEYKRVPVLILDSVNKLAEEQPGLLDLFQGYARVTADDGIVSVVFVSSDGYVPQRMIEKSSWSRHGEIVEIGDVSKEEALQYLKLRTIDEEQAAQIYELIGGRMIHLRFIADYIEKGTLEAMRQIMFSDVKSQLRSAQMIHGRRYQKDGAVIIRKLLEKGSISQRTYYNLVDADTGDKLLDKNVFAIHGHSRGITFQSTVMKRFCEGKFVGEE